MSVDDVIWPFSRDIGLLLAAGLSGRDAARCIGRALEANVAPLEQAVMDGLVSEEAGYRALADFLGLPFAAQPLKASPETPWPEAAINGVAPLAPNNRGWRFAIAPRGRVLKQCLGWDVRRPAGGVVVAAPSRLDQSVAEACALRAQLAAAHRLPDRSPSDSARDGPGARLMAWFVTATAVMLASLIWDVRLTLTLLSLFVGALFLINVMLRLAATASDWPPAHQHPMVSAARLPIYTLLVPLYREANMAPRLATALCAIDYPGIMAQLPQAFCRPDHHLMPEEIRRDRGGAVRANLQLRDRCSRRECSRRGRSA